MENKLTDNEIVKSLESLLDRMRAYESQQASIGKGLVEDIISMYNRKNAEVERLNKTVVDLNTNLSESIHCFTRMESLYKIKCKELDVAKAEAIKEFAERLLKKELESKYFSHIAFQALNFDTNNLVKEMVGEKDV